MPSGARNADLCRMGLGEAAAGCGTPTVKYSSQNGNQNPLLQVHAQQSRINRRSVRKAVDGKGYGRDPRGACFPSKSYQKLEFKSILHTSDAALLSVSLPRLEPPAPAPHRTFDDSESKLVSGAQRRSVDRLSSTSVLAKTGSSLLCPSVVTSSTLWPQSFVVAALSRLPSEFARFSPSTVIRMLLVLCCGSDVVVATIGLSRSTRGKNSCR
ncbi:hypothetical protein C8R45DRAFT_327099 [Mycena sanguinolenta]|nr:hypothetical protein C8R45DRAFT_327099 [Mycena sanguinolenta]